MTNVPTDEKALKQLLHKMKDLPEFVELNSVTPTTKGNFGNTPLHVAAAWGNKEAITLLLKCGADINSQGEGGYTPLHEAVEQNHLEAVKQLLSLGADRKIHNEDGKTPLDIAHDLDWQKGIKFLQALE